MPVRLNSPEEAGVSVSHLHFTLHSLPLSLSWWLTARQMFQSGNGVQRLIAVDPKSLTPAVLQKLQPFIENPEFTVDAVGKASIAAAQLCAWVRFTWSAAQPDEGE